MELTKSLLLVLTVGTHLIYAQESGWQDGQVNATMCQWQLPRGGVIRDTLYLDGGSLGWLPGMSDGTYGSLTADGNPLGLVYLLNFSIPFNTSQNISEVLSSISGAPGGGAATNLYPQYYDGVMFTNDEEFYLYGGLLANTSAYSLPAKDYVEGYEKYQYGPYRSSFSSSFVSGTLPSGLTRYVVGGGGVSIPSQNQGYYFAGMTSSNGGPIYSDGGNDTSRPNTLSHTLISIDMSTQGSETWKNATFPSFIPGRANPELAWIPVSSEGALIAIGGVINPEWLTSSQSDTPQEASESESTSPTFMETVAVYDIANETWYLQNTTGDIPPALTLGCSVVATASDNSSHNIYWYGGFNGIDSTTDFSDDVYVLSIPSFIWTKFESNDTTLGRAGHRCFKPYPDQMFVIGGFPTQSGVGSECLPGGLIRFFNISSGEWYTSYDPTIWSNYTIPSAIYAKIGGTETGGATVTSPDKWSNDSLAALFGTTYEQKITNWYPYPKADQTNTTRPNLPTPTQVSSGGGLPSWVAPFLGVILGLMAISAIAAAFFIYKHRQYVKRRGTSEAGTSEVNRNRIMSWVFGMPGGPQSDAKAPTVVSEETLESTGQYTSVASEVANNEVYEMQDTSVPHELQGVGMSYVKPSTSRASRHSSRPAVSPVQSFSGLAESTEDNSESRVVSGVSVSSSDARHLRQHSDVGSVSTDGAPSLITPDEISSGSTRPGVASPVSPPTPQPGVEQTEYFSINRSVSGRPSEEARRTSRFGEHLDGNQ